MSEPTHIRRFDPSDREYQAVASVAAQFPGEQLSDFEYNRAADIRDFDAPFAGSGHVLRRYVVEVGGAIAGYAQLFQMPWQHDPGSFWLNLRVGPTYERHGIGGRLYQHIMADLQELGATAAWI